MSRRRALSSLCCAVLVALPGCGREEDGGMPAACREGEGAVREALRAAPGDVSMDGTLLSECLDDTTSGGDLQEVGAAYVGVASDLASRAADEPEGAAATRLGYLVGALRRSGAGAQGVGAELERRIQQELSAVDTGSRAFRRGLAAGSVSG